MAHRLDDVAGPGLALGADHRRALADPPQRLAEIGGAADERDLEVPLVDVVGLVGRGEDFRLVDVINLKRLQHLRLGEVADPRLGHHRDRHRLLDALDHGRVRHPRHAAVTADVGGDALQRHHRGGAGVLGDLGLLSSDHIHDHAALEHLGQAGLDREGRLVARGVAVVRSWAAECSRALGFEPMSVDAVFVQDGDARFIAGELGLGRGPQERSTAARRRAARSRLGRGARPGAAPGAGHLRLRAAGAARRRST